MSYSSYTVSHLLGGQLIGIPRVKASICKTICLLPDELIERTVKTTWFISTPKDAWAMTFKGSEHKKDHLIYLSDELFAQGENQIRYTILHEIGHVVLNHSNSISKVQTQSDIKKQELEADQFAKKYLSIP